VQIGLRPGPLAVVLLRPCWLSAVEQACCGAGAVLCCAAAWHVCSLPRHIAAQHRTGPAAEACLNSACVKVSPTCVSQQGTFAPVQMPNNCSVSCAATLHPCCLYLAHAVPLSAPGMLGPIRTGQQRDKHSRTMDPRAALMVGGDSAMCVADACSAGLGTCLQVKMESGSAPEALDAVNRKINTLKVGPSNSCCADAGAATRGMQAADQQCTGLLHRSHKAGSYRQSGGMIVLQQHDTVDACVLMSNSRTAHLTTHSSLAVREDMSCIGSCDELLSLACILDAA